MSNNTKSAVVADFQRYRAESEVAVAVAAIRALADVITRCKATTLMGLQKVIVFSLCVFVLCSRCALFG